MTREFFKGDDLDRQRLKDVKKDTAKPVSNPGEKEASLAQEQDNSKEREERQRSELPPSFSPF